MSRSRKSPAPPVALMASAFESSLNALILASIDYDIIAANGAAHELFGYTDGELVGKPLRALYGVEADWLALGETIHRAERVEIATTLRHASTSLFDADVAVTPLADTTGRRTGVALSMRPRLHQSTDSPDDYSRILLLARGAAHDLNNLLAVIQGNVQLAEMRTADPKVQRFLTDAGQACGLAANLAGQMAHFARDVVVTPVRIDLPQFFTAHKALFENCVRAKTGLAIATKSGTPRVFADRYGLANALINLIKNASDATPDGGEISIEASAAELAGADPAVAISVRDTGTGMTARVKERAFDPFFTTKPAGHGTGLGLASVEGFARQSGGVARIDSKLGHGTTATLILPAASD